MVEIAEIDERDALEAWLDARPPNTRRADAVAVGYRAAARVLPLYLIAARKSDLRVMPVLRCLLCAEVTAFVRTEAIEEKARAAAEGSFFADPWLKVHFDCASGRE